MTIRAVLFDLFDTLVYAKNTGTRDRAIEMAASVGVQPDNWNREWRATLAEAMRGKIPSLLHRVQKVLAQAGARECEPTLVDEMTALLLVRISVHLHPDVRNALEELKKRGYRLGVIGNVPHDETEWVRELELDKYFNTLVLSSEVGLTKPDAEIYLLAAQRVSVPPEECVFVGDGMFNELSGAQAVGMQAVRIDRDFQWTNTPRDESFDFRVDNLEQLLAWLPAQAGQPQKGASQ